MAEVPPGPSALPSSPAESILFPGGGCAVPGEGEERGYGRGGDALIAPGTAGQQQQVSEAKGASKTSQNHLYSHPAALHFHAQTQQQQQQVNGVISPAEDGLLFGHHSCAHSHLHHPAQHHRPPGSQRGPSERRDSSSEPPFATTTAVNSSHNFGGGRSCRDYPQQRQQNHSHSNNNNNSVHSSGGMLTMTRAEEASPGQLSAEEEEEEAVVASRRGDHHHHHHHHHSRTEPRPSPPSDPPDGEDEESGGGGEGEGEGPGAQRAGVEPEAALDGPQTPVLEMARLALDGELRGGRGRGGGGGGGGDEPIQYVRYESELQMPDIMRLITKDLSEPYSIYTYRYFIHNWPQLCFLAVVQRECVGAIVCKLDMHKKMFRRGYIAMLAVDSQYRRKGIGTNLVKKAIYAMVEGDCDEVVLETEITNKSALKLYENLGFVRDKRLFRYYLNGVDALRLKLWLR